MPEENEGLKVAKLLFVEERVVLKPSWKFVPVRNFWLKFVDVGC
jgi:hypothetical protein